MKQDQETLYSESRKVNKCQVTHYTCIRYYMYKV